MTLYFVRHGESEANIRHIISNREQPHGLTERGKQQAGTLAEKLLPIPFDAIFCSPVLRARQTADILSASLGTTYQITEALREYDCGVLEDQSDEESWQRHQYYFNEWMLCRNYESKPEGGESFVEIRNRFLPFIESLKSFHNESVLLIGHGGLFLLMLPLILTNIDNEFVRSHGVGNTECIIVESCSDGFVCRQWGEIQFDIKGTVDP